MPPAGGAAVGVLLRQPRAAEDGALLADGAVGEAGEVDGSEVDELRWVVPAEALELLTYERDRDLVTAALAARD